MSWLRQFLSDEGGQGITEYACVLAFTSLIIVMVFSVGNGTFSDAIFGCFSSMASQIEALNVATFNAT